MTCGCNNSCRLIDKCCGKRKKKRNMLSDFIQHRPTERIIERKIVEIADKCPPDCDCGGNNVGDETQ